MTARDASGHRVYKHVEYEDGWWGVNVWMGNGQSMVLMRYYYATRRLAREANISDQVGEHGRVD